MATISNIRGASLAVASLLLTTTWAAATANALNGPSSTAPPSEGWTGEPTQLGGTARYDGGEWIYQDFVYDDYGADTGEGSQPASLAHTAGDFRYPSDPRFGQNAADVLEVRVRPQEGDLDVRVELNTLIERGTTVLGVAVDAGAGQVSAWPRQAGVQSVWDHFVRVAEGEVWLNRAQGPSVHIGSASVDLASNTVAFRVPDVAEGSSVDLAIGAGLWDETNDTWLAGSTAPQATGGFFSGLAPTTVRVFDLAFNTRAIEPRSGSWQEDA